MTLLSLACEGEGEVSASNKTARSVHQRVVESSCDASLLGPGEWQCQIDPSGNVGKGQSKFYEFYPSPDERSFTAVVYWDTPNEKRLSVRLFASDGQALGDELLWTAGADRHRIVAVDLEKLRAELPEKVGRTAWRLEVSANDVADEQREYFSYSILVDSSIAFTASLTPENPKVGEPSILTARLDRMATAEVFAQLRGRNVDIKPRYLALRDDGVAPDKISADGIYTVNLSALDRTGLYEVKVRLAGQVTHASGQWWMRRERTVQFSVTEGP